MAKEKEQTVESELIPDLVNKCSGIGSAGVMINGVYVELAKQPNPPGMYALYFRDLTSEQARKYIDMCTGVNLLSGDGAFQASVKVPTLLEQTKVIADGKALYDLMVKHGMASTVDVGEFASLKPAHFAKINTFTDIEYLRSYFADRLGDVAVVENLVNEVAGTTTVKAPPKPPKPPTLIERVRVAATAEDAEALYKALCEHGMASTVDVGEFKSLKKPHYMKIAEMDFDALKTFFTDRLADAAVFANLVNEIGATPTSANKSEEEPDLKEDPYVKDWDNKDSDNDAIMKELHEADKFDKALRVFLKYGCPANVQTLKEIVMKFIVSGHAPPILKDSDENNVARGSGRVVKRWLKEHQK